MHSYRVSYSFALHTQANISGNIRDGDSFSRYYTYAFTTLATILVPIYGKNASFFAGWELPWKKSGKASVYNKEWLLF